MGQVESHRLTSADLCRRRLLCAVSPRGALVYGVSCSEAFCSCFPGGYKRVADKFKPGLTVYRWKYVKPGEKLGMSFDGLVYVNNHWA